MLSWFVLNCIVLFGIVLNLIDTDQRREISRGQKLIKDNLGIDVNENPEIQISENLIRETSDKFNIKEDEIKNVMIVKPSIPSL